MTYKASVECKKADLLGTVSYFVHEQKTHFKHLIVEYRIGRCATSDNRKLEILEPVAKAFIFKNPSSLQLIGRHHASFLDCDKDYLV